MNASYVALANLAALLQDKPAHGPSRGQGGSRSRQAHVKSGLCCVLNTQNASARADEPPRPCTLQIEETAQMYGFLARTLNQEWHD